MAKRKGKTPSLLAVSTGTPEPYTCGRATSCERCEESVPTNARCFRIPKMSSGYTHRPIFCVACTIAIIEQTKIELSAVEQEVRGKGSKY